MFCPLLFCNPALRVSIPLWKKEGVSEPSSTPKFLKSGDLKPASNLAWSISAWDSWSPPEYSLGLGPPLIPILASIAATSSSWSSPKPPL